MYDTYRSGFLELRHCHFIGDQEDLQYSKGYKLRRTPVVKAQSSGVRPNVDIAHRQSKQFASDNWDRTYDWPAAKILEGTVLKLGYTDPNSGQ